MKWILKCLKNIKNYDLLFDRLLENAKSLLDYIDADYRQDLDQRKFRTRYVITLGDRCIS